jgi:hypothetical protein
MNPNFFLLEKELKIDKILIASKWRSVQVFRAFQKAFIVYLFVFFPPIF